MDSEGKPGTRSVLTPKTSTTSSSASAELLNYNLLRDPEGAPSSLKSETVNNKLLERKITDESCSALAPTHKGVVGKLRNGFRLDTSGENDDGAYSVSASFSLVSVFFLVIVCLLTVKYLDGRLPTALQQKDIEKHPNSFIEERARKDLHHLISVGVRVSGSKATDVDTVNNFKDILQDIKSNMLSSDVTLDVDDFRPTGVFYQGSNEVKTSVYSKIADVVVKLEPADRTRATNNSILVNCHFDSKTGSPGATDNMISCVTMLEVIRILASEKHTSLRNPIIFLFNGAEETGLQGAHGFVKGYLSTLGNPDKAEVGHKWAKNVRTFINLEGAGGGGREILFQTGPGHSWTLETYAKAAPYPYGLVIAEEAFQFGLIPSDTDFRIFRDYGELAGLDMAFIKNGWVYHTKWDRDSEVPAGSIQHMGANTLAILRHYSGKVNFDEIDMNSNGKVVYFDVLGLFMIYYPRWAGILIDVLIALGTIVAIVIDVLPKARRKRKLAVVLIWLPISAIISWVAGIAVAAIVALFLNGCGYYKPFYSYPSLAFVIFGIPAAIAQIIVHAHILNGSPMQSWMAQKLALAVILFVLTFLTRAVYILSINLLFSVLAWNMMRYLCKGWPRGITLSYLIAGEFIPLLMSIYLLVTLSDVFVPILGHSGSETNANLFFGVIVASVVTVLIWNGFTFIFVQFRKRILWTCLFASFFVLNTALVFGFVGTIPYQEKTPLKLSIVNVDRTWYESDQVTARKTDAGYWFWPEDSNTKDYFDTMEKFVPELAQVEHASLDFKNCESLYCAHPFMRAMGQSAKSSYWLPHNKSLSSTLKSSPTFGFTVTNSTAKASRKSVEMSFDGPSQTSFVLSPGPKYKLVSWTLAESIPESGELWKGRPTYFIYHGRGFDSTSQTVKCEFELTSGSEDKDDTIVTIQKSEFYMYGDDLMTDEFRDLVNRLPVWTYTMPWTAIVKIYDLKDTGTN